MFERFTDQARRVVVLAQEEARMLDHDYIGTEHLLLGLIHEGEGIASRALEALGISLADVRGGVEEIIGRGPTAPTGNIPFTPRAKKVLELSLREALQLGHNYIGPEHILLGVIREGKGVAAQVLGRLGAGPESVRQKVTELLAQAAAVSSGEKFEAFGPGTRRSFVPLSDLPFDHRAVLAVELAQAAARRRGQRTINPLDLLMGLLRARDEEVAGMLQTLGADWVKIRRALEDELGTEGEDTPEPDA